MLWDDKNPDTVADSLISNESANHRIGKPTSNSRDLTSKSKYNLISKIASGGMADVFLAIQSPLESHVALKDLKDEFLNNKETAQRFYQEAQSLAELQHENITTVFDYFSHGNQFIIVMEYVDGVDLYDLVDNETQIDPVVSAIIGRQVAEALDYAHRRDIIHRDVKPANIIVSKRGTAKLSDFGIAKIGTPLGDITRTGLGVGTPAYMSPEQVTGDPLDARSDIWALGVVMYQMTTGKKPFYGTETSTVMQQVRKSTPPRPRSINPSCPLKLESIILKCLRKKPSRRYQNCTELIADLGELIRKRANSDPQKRVVYYLQSKSLISPTEATEILNKIPSARPSGWRLPSMLDSVSTRSGILAAGLFIVFSSGWGLKACTSRSTKSAAVNISTNHPPISELENRNLGHDQMTDHGSIKVVAWPWAHVYIDGEYAFTTPQAFPYKISKGNHRYSLRNPHYDMVSDNITIGNDTETVIEWSFLKKP